MQLSSVLELLNPTKKENIFLNIAEAVKNRLINI